MGGVSNTSESSPHRSAPSQVRSLASEVPLLPVCVCEEMCYAVYYKRNYNDHLIILAMDKRTEGLPVIARDENSLLAIFTCGV